MLRSNSSADIGIIYRNSLLCMFQTMMGLNFCDVCSFANQDCYPWKFFLWCKFKEAGKYLVRTMGWKCFVFSFAWLWRVMFFYFFFFVWWILGPLLCNFVLLSTKVVTLENNTKKTYLVCHFLFLISCMCLHLSDIVYFSCSRVLSMSAIWTKRFHSLILIRLE